MRIYTCNACTHGNHRNCEGSHHCAPGQYGGSRCICRCHGNPDFDKIPSKEMQALLKQLFGKPKTIDDELTGSD